MKKRILLAITGASGSLYALHLLKLLAELDVEVEGIISEAGRKVLEHELGMTRKDLLAYAATWYDCLDLAAPVASGSHRLDAMVVLPCTMGTLAAIASGMSANLIHRAADVTLKERRLLILAPRETPLNRTHLQNMLRAHEAGAMICPPMPAFYHAPQSLDDIARFFAGRICDLLGLPAPIANRWTGMSHAEKDQDTA